MIIYFLEMKKREQLKFKPCTDKDFIIKECIIKNYKFNKFLYKYIGEKWKWNDKNSWSDAKWKSYAEANNLRTFVAYKFGIPAGYYELKSVNSNVEIAYIGLEEKFIGKGYGGYLLSKAIQDSWQWEASRVWVNTCDFDHPVALDNYKKRGMKIYKIEKNE